MVVLVVPELAPLIALPGEKLPAVADKVVDTPAQIVAGLALTVLIGGNGFTVVTTVAEAAQPFVLSDPVTVYV